MDPRVEAMAEVIVNYCVETKPGDWVVIQSPFLGEPLANACARSVLKAGGNATNLFSSEEVEETLLREANDQQISFISPITQVMMEKADATIALLAPQNTRSLSGVDPSQMAFRSKAREPLMETMMERSAQGALRWNISAYPTWAAAQDANMSLRDYANFVYNAAHLNEPDPIASWKRQGERQQELIDWLSDKSTVHITGPGTDLTVGVGGRTWLNDEGTRNFPGGEIFTGPVEDVTEGTIAFSYPAFLAGREVQGVRLVFKGGKVVDASAASDEAYLYQMLDMDAGARVLGEFAFGTNYGIQDFTKNTLFDEKIGGTLHMALGRAYPESGGTNMSALHWDMVFNLRNGSEVTVDGEAFSRNGQFLVGVPA
jgi:aminopeptidase